MFKRITGRGYGVLLLRVFIAVRIVYGVFDNVISWEHMLAFRDFLAGSGFPVPLVCAVVSVYVQFLGGLLLLSGLFTRPAAALLAVNFGVATSVHWEQGFEAMTPPLALLFGCGLLLLDGPGPFSFDRSDTNRPAAN